MDSRRMTTRSSRRASNAPVTPSVEGDPNAMAYGLQERCNSAVTAPAAQQKGTAKRSSRKVLGDKTNSTPVTKLVPAKVSKKAPPVSTPVAAVKTDEVVVSPCFQLQALEPQQPSTPVLVRGEDLLRSLVHSNLTIIQTPNGPVRQSPEAETPQFGVPAALSPVQDTTEGSVEAAAEVEISTPPQQSEVVDSRPPVEVSPEREISSVSQRLSSAWVGCDVHDVTEVGEDDDSDCSVLVNVSSPGMHLVASPVPDTTVHPTTPQSADFKWQRRDQLPLKVKEQGMCGFNYYAGDEEYEACDEFDGTEDYDGEVIDCDEICQAISRMGVTDAGLPEHKGRHIRFNYNSDDEMEVKEVDVTRLRGVPTPRGKHLRFPEEQEVPAA